MRKGKSNKEQKMRKWTFGQGRSRGGRGYPGPTRGMEGQKHAVLGNIDMKRVEGTPWFPLC